MGGKNQFSASCHQLFCRTPSLVWDHFLFQQTCWENEGGGLKGGRNGFILHDEILSHRKHQTQLLFTATLWLVKIWSVNCCKKPSSAILNSLNLQENHWQVTTRKIWTVSVEGFGMKRNLSFPPNLFKENMKCKNAEVAPRGIILFYSFGVFFTVQREWAIWLLSNTMTYIT